MKRVKKKAKPKAKAVRQAKVKAVLADVDRMTDLLLRAPSDCCPLAAGEHVEIEQEPTFTGPFEQRTDALLQELDMYLEGLEHVGIGEKAKPFQVHALANVDLLRPVCKCVFPVQTVDQIPAARMS